MRHLSTRLLQKVSAQAQWGESYLNSHFILFFQSAILQDIYTKRNISAKHSLIRNRISLHNLFDPIVSVLLCSAINIALRIGTKEIL